MSRLTLFMVAALATLPATAQPADPSGFPFLRLEPSARASAMAGAFGSIYDADVNALFYNPAQLNESMHGTLSLSYLNHLSDLNAGFIAYARHYDRIGTVGAGLRFLNWGTIQGSTETGEKTGEFGAGDVALTVGAARAYTERVRYGANVHVIYSSVESFSASALAADVGVTYLVPNALLSISATVNNLGVTLSSLGGTNDDLPVDVRVGVSKRIRHLPLLVSVTAYNLHNYDAVSPNASVTTNVLHHLAIGGEFQFSEAFNVRLGYNHRRHTELKTKTRLDFAGLGVGVGIKVNRFRFDYAYNSWSSLGGLNQLTLGTTI